MSAHRRAPRSLSLALDHLSAELSPASTLASVQVVWEQAVGEAIAAAATPKTEHNGVLTVTCQTAAWAHELDLMSDDLVQCLNLSLGVSILTELRCRLV